MMTKQDAKKIFRWGLSTAAWIRLQQDKPALREEWNKFTDRLCKDNQITSQQYDRWQNPFLKEDSRR